MSIQCRTSTFRWTASTATHSPLVRSFREPQLPLARLGSTTGTNAGPVIATFLNVYCVFETKVRSNEVLIQKRCLRGEF